MIMNNSDDFEMATTGYKVGYVDHGKEAVISSIKKAFDSEEFMDNFMDTLNNMKKYQGIDITRPETYFNNSDIVHDAFNFEKNVIARVEPKEIKEVESSKQLLLTRKDN